MRPRAKRSRTAWTWLPPLLLAVGCQSLQDTVRTQWVKGNLHTHTFWSDGDDFPERIVKWYKDHGYDFLALSDHNVFQNVERWMPVSTNATHQLALQKYQAEFGQAVRLKTNAGQVSVRLATLRDLKARFEEPDKFLLIPSEEITAQFEKLPVHINASNLRELIKPRSGTNVLDVMQKNINAVIEQRQRTGQPMIPHLNHPNFHYAITPEDLMRVRGERFFEVYNGHPAVFNEGDATHPGTDRIWDTVLAWRLAILGMEPMYGVAVDDSHHYHEMKPQSSNPGRGWIMVRASKLAPEAIIHAMEAGDFYATSGVRLKSVHRGRKRLAVEIEPEPGVEYTIQFLGTRTDFQSRGDDGEPRADPARIGLVLAETRATKASYSLRSDELYVRARILSSKRKENAVRDDEVEQAWTQPVIQPRYLVR